MKFADDITALLEIMTMLRHPQTGCAWDIEQTFSSIIPYTIEEAYEVADAISRGDFVDLCEELGDLLLQVVYHARMAEEQGAFTFHDVVSAIVHKMRRRHPHIFGTDEEQARGAAPDQWQKIKAEEKQERRLKRREAGLEEEQYDGLLDGVSPALPPIIEAVKLQQKAATIGFDWENIISVLAKLEEEMTEIKDAMEVGDKDKIEEEYGDVIFTLLNLGRKLDIEPQAALRRTNLKFRRRFSFIEKALDQKDKTLDETSLEQMEALWNQAKAF